MASWRRLERVPNRLSLVPLSRAAKVSIARTKALLIESIKAGHPKVTLWGAEVGEDPIETMANSW